MSIIVDAKSGIPEVSVMVPDMLYVFWALRMNEIVTNKRRRKCLVMSRFQQIGRKDFKVMVFLLTIVS
ncbi:MAG: hypothetical protein ACI9FN_002566 [Saprospiraceae bacterium]|jgi:hypothetical protein